MKISQLFLVGLIAGIAAPGMSARLLVSEYGTGNIRAYDPVSGAPISLPSHYTPVGGNSSGADGMVRDPQGRLMVNRGNGTISRRSVDGNSFSTFANLGVDYLLDLDRNTTHLFAARYAYNVLYQVSLTTTSIVTIAGPAGSVRFDGVRVGPDGRVYAADSSNGAIYAYDLTNTTWSTFLSPHLAGDASQLEFGSDGRVFLSRTIGGQARIYAYQLNTPGNYPSGLNTNSATLIGAYGSSGAATGIRIGPDNRLYANAFNAGQVWRSNVGITAMEASAFITGLNEPGSLFFEIDNAEPPGIVIDFGINTNLTASPDANGRFWNNVSTDASTPPSGTLTNLINTTNGLSGISLTVAGFGAGANANGSTTPDAALGSLAVTNAVRDSFFVATGDTARVVFSGLPTGRLFRIECFGSRDAADTRITRYTAAGHNSASATAQTSGTLIGAPPLANANNAFLAVLDPIRPTASGVVTVSVGVAAGPFGYLGALRLTPLGEVTATNEPPTATDVFVVGPPVAGRTVTAYYTYSDPEGDPESASIVEWQVDVPPFTNPFLLQFDTNRSFTVPHQTGAYIRAAIQPRAAAGATNGAWTFSGWHGPIAPSNAIAVFHVGNSFTRWGHIPLQLQTLAAEAGVDHVYGEQLADGMGLGYHWTNGLAGGVLTRGTPSRLELPTGGWDWLVLQPMSREWTPANLDAFRDFARSFAALAASNGTRVALYHYWNYLDEGPATQDDINTAFETVRAHLASNGVDVIIIPSGIAFTNAVAAIATLDRADLYQDNLHPGDAGYYLSALTHYATLHRRSPVGLTNRAVSAAAGHDDPVLIDPALAVALQQVAWDTARYHPRSGVTRGRFAAWAASLPAGQRDWLDDPFTNGVPNLLRWAYGMSTALANQPERQLQAIREAGQPLITYVIGDDAEDAGIRITEQWSTNLTAWTTSLPVGLTRSRTNQQVWISGTAAETNVFLRLRLEAP
ncbi:MAG TPA: hypothetical protein PKE26_11695 [Kiritimatiellia bacterium]|nr:hypothetical protein [Kiritimatiellia bacterium]HMO99763.1 hypothetical protein [Kiritimatiellia bacterium]